jgi:hypothetical protein
MHNLLLTGKGVRKVSTLLIFLGGIVFLALVLLIKDRAMKGPTWKKILNWVLFAGFIFVTYTGISFIYINASVGHVKATSTAVFVFLGTALVLAIILMRLLGYINIGSLTRGSAKETTSEATNEAASEATKEVASEATNEVASEATNEVASEATNEATNETTNEAIDTTNEKASSSD